MREKYPYLFSQVGISCLYEGLTPTSVELIVTRIVLSNILEVTITSTATPVVMNKALTVLNSSRESELISRQRNKTPATKTAVFCHTIRTGDAGCTSSPILRRVCATAVSAAIARLYGNLVLQRYCSIIGLNRNGSCTSGFEFEGKGTTIRISANIAGTGNRHNGGVAAGRSNASIGCFAVGSEDNPHIVTSIISQTVIEGTIGSLYIDRSCIDIRDIFDNNLYIFEQGAIRNLDQNVTLLLGSNQTAVGNGSNRFIFTQPGERLGSCVSIRNLVCVTNRQSLGGCAKSQSCRYRWLSGLGGGFRCRGSPLPRSGLWFPFLAPWASLQAVSAWWIPWVW